jgi:hypothetical protein
MLTRKRNREIDIEKAAPLSLLFTAQFREIFETHIVPKLRPRSEIKFLKMAFKDARDAVRRADIFEKHIVPKLRPRSDLKFLKMAFKDARDAFRRSKIKVEEKFNISEFTSISQMEFAWDNYRWDEDGYKGTQEWFCMRVSRMNKLEYLVWLREVKNCDWDRVYGKMHYLGAAIAVCGLLLLIISDKENGPSEQESNPILGDFLALMAACSYSLSNIIQESFIDSGMSMSKIFSAFVVFMAASLRSPLSYSSIDLALQGFLNSLNQSIVFTSFPRMQCSR